VRRHTDYFWLTLPLLLLSLYYAAAFPAHIAIPATPHTTPCRRPRWLAPLPPRLLDASRLLLYFAATLLMMASHGRHAHCHAASVIGCDTLPLATTPSLAPQVHDAFAAAARYFDSAPPRLRDVACLPRFSCYAAMLPPFCRLPLATLTFRRHHAHARRHAPYHISPFRRLCRHCCLAMAPLRQLRAITPHTRHS